MRVTSADRPPENAPNRRCVTPNATSTPTVDVALLTKQRSKSRGERLFDAGVPAPMRACSTTNPTANGQNRRLVDTDFEIDAPSTSH